MGLNVEILKKTEEVLLIDKKIKNEKVTIKI